mmetsp:Transcript_13867/g.47939  ORF Transcript_13867/g.47939 Transcript_13867/m.47939 type:complete len:168 (-) Transcript_13867:17-520(-)
MRCILLAPLVMKDRMDLLGLPTVTDPADTRRIKLIRQGSGFTWRVMAMEHVVVIVSLAAFSLCLLLMMQETRCDSAQAGGRRSEWGRDHIMLSRISGRMSSTNHLNRSIGTIRTTGSRHDTGLFCVLESLPCPWYLLFFTSISCQVVLALKLTISKVRNMCMFVYYR